MNERVYVQTNDAERNEVIAFDRSGDGRLSPLGRYDTGGRGTGKPHLASQGSIVLSNDGAWLLVANAGSDELSLFAVEQEGLRLAGRVASGGSGPTSASSSGTAAWPRATSRWRTCSGAVPRPRAWGPCCVTDDRAARYGSSA